MPLSDLSIAFIAALVAWYWGRVLQKALRSRRRHGRSGNIVPAEPLGRWLRLLWIPAVIGWVAIPLAAAAGRARGFWLEPVRSPSVPLAVAAAGVALLSVILTEVCWKRMGRAWRMGIAPGERTELITSGPYAHLRHPIYTLSLSFAAATGAAWPAPLLLICLGNHALLITWEAIREEKHLVEVHGEVYRRYLAQTGRFFPRLAPPLRSF